MVYGKLKAEVKNCKGTPALHLNNKPVFTMQFAIPSPNGIYNAQFADCGVHVFQHIIRKDYDYKKIKKDIDAVIRADKDAKFLLRVEVDAPAWWEKSHPDEMQRDDQGGRHGQSLASELWRKERKEKLTLLVKYLEKIYRERIIGYMLCAGETGEWFYRGYVDFRISDFSRPMERTFRNWLRRKYKNLSELQREWNNNRVDFGNVGIPSRDERLRCNRTGFRDVSTERNVIDYFEFLSELIVQDITYFGKAVKSASSRDVLCGAFYGYNLVFAWHPYLYQHSGHLALKKMLESRHIDFLSSPNNYINRGMGGTAASMTTLDSVKMHKKLWFAETDTRTFLASPEQDAFGRPENLEDSLAIIKRDFARTLTSGVDMWWFDLENSGWFADRKILALMRNLKKIGDGSLGLDRSSVSEIAVFIDEESFAYQDINNNVTYPLIIRNLQYQLSRIGSPYDTYLLSDIGNLNHKQYKMYIFLNAFYVSDACRTIMNLKVKAEDKLCVWFYAPGIINNKGFSLDNVRALTGIKASVKYQAALPYLRLTDNMPEITEGINPRCFYDIPGQVLDGWLNPVYYAEDRDAEVLGEFLDNQKPGLVLRKFRDWTSIYCAVPEMPFPLFRSIARYCGVHIYGDAGDVIYVNKSFLAIHTKYGGVKKIRLKKRTSVYDLFARKRIVKDKDFFVRNFPPRSTSLFRIF
ncbi:MAG: beta-galactosidase [Candidatus Omnitrophota bacterium]